MESASTRMAEKPPQGVGVAEYSLSGAVVVTAVLVPLAVACGVSGQCWNPVFVTAMSFEVADEELAEMNGRAFSFLSIGWMGAAPVFWALIEFTGGYVVPYIIIALANLGVIAVLLRGGKGEK